ncbi:hypothetical protein AVEN_204203-1 [Araneus ventricosus]|uniref:Uncharacterized protein n=1 Tax=Araneus ventricosus TaxID=182803 RepID=A0A4Y2SQD0_ARAVE|nr:hypothetical protein AVEN_204203-1 [Araneus ventricosus]
MSRKQNADTPFSGLVMIDRAIRPMISAHHPYGSTQVQFAYMLAGHGLVRPLRETAAARKRRITASCGRRLTVCDRCVLIGTHLFEFDSLPRYFSITIMKNLLIVIGFLVAVGSDFFIHAGEGETAPFWGSIRERLGENTPAGLFS